MWNYEKRLEFPVNIKRTDPKMAQLIITQYGGPDGELGASMRYLSQRFAMPYKNVCGVLTDIGKSLSKHELVAGFEKNSDAAIAYKKLAQEVLAK